MGQQLSKRRDGERLQSGGSRSISFGIGGLPQPGLSKRSAATLLCRPILPVTATASISASWNVPDRSISRTLVFSGGLINALADRPSGEPGRAQESVERRSASGSRQIHQTELERRRDRLETRSGYFGSHDRDVGAFAIDEARGVPHAGGRAARRHDVGRSRGLGPILAEHHVGASRDPVAGWRYRLRQGRGTVDCRAVPAKVEQLAALLAKASSTVRPAH